MPRTAPGIDHASLNRKETAMPSEFDPIHSFPSRTGSSRQSDPLSEMTLDAGRGIFDTMKSNAADYGKIDQDPDLSAVDKAVGKRKILALDILLGGVTITGSLGLLWLARKIFPS